MSVLTAFASQYSFFLVILMVCDDFIMMRKTSCTSLSAIIGDGLKVKKLSINGIFFGDENGFSKLELSKDRSYLFIYTEDGFVSVAKMPISGVQLIKFGIDDDEFELYP